MFENDFFDEWLNEEAAQVQNRIKSGEGLSSDDKIVLILKAQTNHFHHLDIEFREEMKAQRADFQVGLQVLREDMDKRFEQMRVDMDKRFEQVDKRFEQVDKRFEQVDRRFEQMNDELKKLYQAINTQTWKMIGAIGLIVVLGRLAGNFTL